MRLFEAGLGRADIGNCVRCQNFGFDAQKLGLIPTFAGSFGRIDRLLDGVDGLPVVVSQREGLCPHAEPMIEMVSHADRFSAPQPSSISRSPLVKEPRVVNTQPRNIFAQAAYCESPLSMATVKHGPPVRALGVADRGSD